MPQIIPFNRRGRKPGPQPPRTPGVIQRVA